MLLSKSCEIWPLKLTLNYSFLSLFLIASLFSFIQHKENSEIFLDLKILVVYEYASASPDNKSSDSIDFDIHVYASIHALAELFSLNGFAHQNALGQLLSFITLIRAPPSIH